MNKNSTSSKPGGPLLFGLVILIVLGAVGLVATSWHLVENVDEHRKKIKEYDVKAKNPFDSSSLPIYYEHKKLNHGLHDQYLPECSTLLKLGHKLKSKHQYEKCIEVCTRALNLYESAPDSKKGPDTKLFPGACHRCIGKCYLLLKNYDKALKHLTSAYECTGSSKDLTFRATVYRKLGKTDLALADEKQSKIIDETQNTLLEDLDGNSSAE